MGVKLITLFIVIAGVIISVVYWTNNMQVDAPSVPVKRETEEKTQLYVEKLSSMVKSLLDITKNSKTFINQTLDIGNIVHNVNSYVKIESTKLHDANVTRIAVLCYIPRGDTQAYHFLTMLFGSWKYIIENKEDLIQSADYYHNIDLLAFCHPSICPQISHVCDHFNYTNVNILSKCWAVRQHHEFDIGYGPINSFIMFNRTDISKILNPYKYVLRTDFDVFVGPSLFTWVPTNRIIAGQGGYCDPFNMKRLKEISNKLGMRHQGVHCVGSTWYGETALFIQLSRKTIELTAYMYLNEFDPKLPGLETIDFKKNREGEWVRWWRPVSSMYGAEMALNHMIDNFSTKFKGKLDTPSCSKDNIWTTPHIHCWHSDCEFQKFKFMKYLLVAINSHETLPGEIINRILKNVYNRDIQHMSVSEYSTYIAWHSVSKYLRKQFKA